MESNPKENIIEEVTNKDYEFGFVTDIETDFIPKGLNEDIIRLISKKKEEPEWLAVGFPFEGVPSLADFKDAYMGAPHHPTY